MYLFSPQIEAPKWIPEFLQNRVKESDFSADNTVPSGSLFREYPIAITDRDERVRFTVEMACENVRYKTGGPFAAASFERESGRLFSLGVNSVVPAGQSYAHAEMMAVSAAQSAAGTFDLRPFDLELVSSCEPCAMCFGGIPWSGIVSFVYGAPREEPEKIGFDEGEKISDWHEVYKRRGIDVFGPLLSEETVSMPFRLYTEMVGKIY